MSIFEIIKQLQATTKKTRKLEILQENIDNKFLEKILHATYSSEVFKIKQFKPVKCSVRSLINFEDEFDSILNNVRKRSGHDLSKYIEDTQTLLNADEQIVFLGVLSKSLDIGVSSNTISKVWGGYDAETTPMMLCKSYEHIANIEFPAFVQIKSDGMRINLAIQDRQIITRSGKTFITKLSDLFFDSLTKAQQKSLAGYVLDGEAVVYRDGEALSRKTSNGILNKAIVKNSQATITDDEMNEVEYVLWDIIPIKNWKDRVKGNITYEERLKLLQDLIKDIPKVHYVENYEVASLEDGLFLYEQFRARELEGCIFKNKNSYWSPKKSSDQIKKKAAETIDLRITAVTEGQGKYVNMLGKFTCVTDDGIIKVDVGSGFSDAQRIEYYKSSLIGSIVEVEYNEIIINKKTLQKSLFIPIFVTLRPDKNTTTKLSE